MMPQHFKTFLLQTFFNNPIAGPFVLGISSGAKLTVALTMIFLLGKIMNQNFVPVLDDQKNFIGIITRKDVISYLCKK